MESEETMTNRIKPFIAGVIATSMLAAVIPAANAATPSEYLALDVLDTLTVEPQQDDYNQNTDRPDGWAQNNDNPGDYSDTRDTILSRDLSNVTYNEDHHVITGTLNDPYTGEIIEFRRTNYAGPGTGYSNAVQIDHVVAFGEAWDSGLNEASPDVVEEYYNDPYVLLAVKGPANSSKSDSDAAEWLPSTYRADHTGYDCYYVARQIGIKHKYNLSVDLKEKEAMENVMASCPTMTIPEGGGAYWGDYTEHPSTSDPTYTVEDLKDLGIKVGGHEYKDFSYDKTEYTVDYPMDVTFTNIPSGWNVGKYLAGNGVVVYTLTAPNAEGIVSYRFTPSTADPDNQGGTSGGQQTGTPTNPGQTGGDPTNPNPGPTGSDPDTNTGDGDKQLPDLSGAQVVIPEQKDGLAQTGVSTGVTIGIILTLLAIGAAGVTISRIRNKQ